MTQNDTLIIFEISYFDWFPDAIDFHLFEDELSA